MKKSVVLLLMLQAVLCLYARAEITGHDVSEITLDNGMTFLIMNRDFSPTFAGLVLFKVGGVDEKTGTTGIAHMFEHMAFKGTTEIGTADWEKEKPILEKIEKTAQEIARLKAQRDNPDPEKQAELEEKLHGLQEEAAQYQKAEEFTGIYEKNGSGTLNAGTGKDSTIYMVELPSNRLELWMLMESERIKNPVLREFYKERDVVAEERRMYQTYPSSVLTEEFLAAAFRAHPYRIPTIGWLSDIQALTRTDAEKFRKTYYVPANAVGILVGDLDLEKTEKLIRKYFGDIPESPLPPAVRTEEPDQRGERRIEVEFDAEPQVMIGYHIPRLPHPDAYAVSALSDILTDGKSARLYKKLVRDMKIARYVSSGDMPGWRYDPVFYFSSQPIHPHTCGELESAIYEELEKLKEEPVSDKELEKVINQLEAGFVRGMDSNLGLAFQLGYFEAFAGGWDRIEDHIKKMKKVTPEKIMEAARKYFTEENRTVAALVKKEKQKSGEGGKPDPMTREEGGK